jgi:hypothetical protein
MKRSRRVGRGLSSALGKLRWQERDAEVVLEAWSNSGLELREFARRHELRPVRLQRWSERLGSGQNGVRFHPVELRLDGLSRVEPLGGGVEVVVRGGRRVVVEREFDEEHLARVVRVVESLSC